MTSNKQITEIDPAMQEQLLNISNDPLYEEKLAKLKKQNKGAALKLIEDYSAKAREVTGLDETEIHEKTTALTSAAIK